MCAAAIDSRRMGRCMEADRENRYWDSVRVMKVCSAAHLTGPRIAHWRAVHKATVGTVADRGHRADRVPAGCGYRHATPGGCAPGPSILCGPRARAARRCARPGHTTTRTTHESAD